MMDHEKNNPYMQEKFDYFPPAYKMTPQSQIESFQKRFRYFNPKCSETILVNETYKFCVDYVQDTLEDRIGMI
jgi:hypothetical protein